MMRWLMGIMAVLLAGCSTPAIRTDDGNHVMTAARAPFELVLPKGDWKLARTRQASDGDNQYFLLGDKARGLSASIFIQPATRCRTAEECRQYWWVNRGPDFHNPLGVREYDENGFAVVRFVIPRIRKAMVVQQNISAHAVRDGYWVDVRISKLFAGADDLEPMSEVVRGLRFRVKATNAGGRE